MEITKTTPPDSSVLRATENNYHYVDSFQGTLKAKHHDTTPKEIAKAFFSSEPKWITNLFSLRNTIVSVFGLKTPVKVNNRERILNNFTCDPGEQIGLFKVINKTDSEIILGEDDKHLNFRVSMLIEPYKKKSQKRKLIITTTVSFHNWLGRIYFLPVKPFHRLIVPTMLQSTIQNLAKQDN
ncbi:DUF2867 domain-containing protein [Fodinibius saliphilus]|uniref:DUF2867 domain-containing protein n=1 Tax=Fodinibius saliphilus TaxID=1920650 RepID=UPI0011091553|nr:DUF2867 domain-containing protein [Fodinibius saliphilus]